MLDTDSTEGSDAPDGGWAFVSDRDGAARLFDALLALDPEETYTRSEIAEQADVPLKTLYLNDLLDEFVALGVLAEDAGGGESPTGTESQYRVHTDSKLFSAAQAFDDAYDSRTE